MTNMISKRLFRNLMLAVVTSMTIPVSEVARAQSKSPEAREQEAKDAYNRSDFERARQIYTELYTADPRSKYLWDLALVENKEHHFVDALRHFKAYLKSPEASARDRDNAQAYLRGLEAETGHIAVDAPPGTHLLVDGADTDRETPLDEPLDVEPGRHAVEGRREGKSTSATVQAGAGQTVTAHLVVEPEPRGAKVESSAATVSKENEGFSAPSGEATPSGQPVAKLVTVIGLGTLALGSFAARIGFGIAASNADDRVSAFRAANGPSACSGSTPATGCASLKDDVDGANRNTTLANVFLGTGIGLVVAAGVTWFVWPKTAPVATTRAGAARLTPWFGPGAAGAAGTVGF